MDFGSLVGVIDWDDLVTSATSGVLTNVEGAVIAVAPLILGIAGIFLAFRRVKSLIR